MSQKIDAKLFSYGKKTLNFNTNEIGNNNNLKESSNKLGSASLLPNDKTNIDLVKPFAYTICQEYLGGVWKSISISDFSIEKKSGGLSNYLYQCEIKNKNLKQIYNEPFKILLRIYGENHTTHSSIILKDVVVSAIMSDFSIGPKLYGIFPTGRLEELIPANSMDLMDLYKPEYYLQIAEIMAKFHTLEMPFIKQPNWLFDTTSKYLKKIKEIQFSKENEIQKYNKIIGFNLEKEFLDLKKVLESLNSLVVFCHNDIQVGNILKLENKLMIIDYEYGSYNYRGFDLGNFFCEWMFNNNFPNHPYFEYKYELFPTREVQLRFIRAYLENFKNIREKKRSKNKIDHNNIETSNEEEQNNNNLDLLMLNEEQALKEANYFALASHLFWANWAVCQAVSSKIQFEYLDYALARCDAYFKQKSLLNL